MITMPRRDRVWVAVGTVTAVSVEEDGHFVSVSLHGLPEGTELPACRVATPMIGLYLPYSEGDDVVVVVPDGMPSAAAVIGKVWSQPIPPPAEAVENPDRIWLVVGGDIHARCKNLTVEASETIQLGADNLEDILDGVVHGRGQDTFTGAMYGTLGSTSQVVKAKK